jgi:glycosyltransferase involved in cell wall biosynthesis
VPDEVLVEERKGPVAFFLDCPGGPGGGGAERATITIANEFAKRGVDVDLVLRRAEGPYADLISSGVNVVRLGAGLDTTSSRLRIYRTNLGSLVSLRGYIKKRKPSAIVSPFLRDNLHVLLAIKLTRATCRAVITQPGTLSWELLHNCNRAQRARWRRVIRWLYPCADSVIAVSRGVAEDLVRIVPGISAKLRVINPPVDVDRIQQLSYNEPDHPWFKNGNHQVILGVGRLFRVKDFPTLVRALARVRQAKSVKLVILGEGEERQRLEALISELGLTEDVSLPGFAKNPFAHMRRSSVFVLSSVTEGCPNVLLEALACGCPVVSTDCPSGPREILQDGKWGELVPVGDVGALAAAIERVLDSPPSPERLKARAAYFSLDRVVDQFYEAVFHSTSTSAPNALL